MMNNIRVNILTYLTEEHHVQAALLQLVKSAHWLYPCYLDRGTPRTGCTVATGEVCSLVVSKDCYLDRGTPRTGCTVATGEVCSLVVSKDCYQD
jgi:hypothetical protein